MDSEALTLGSGIFGLPNQNSGNVRLSGTKLFTTQTGRICSETGMHDRRTLASAGPV